MMMVVGILDHLSLQIEDYSSDVYIIFFFFSASMHDFSFLSSLHCKR